MKQLKILFQNWIYEKLILSRSRSRLMILVTHRKLAKLWYFIWVFWNLLKNIRQIKLQNIALLQYIHVERCGFSTVCVWFTWEYHRFWFLSMANGFQFCSLQIKIQWTMFNRFFFSQSVWFDCPCKSNSIRMKQKLEPILQWKCLKQWKKNKAHITKNKTKYRRERDEWKKKGKIALINRNRWVKDENQMRLSERDGTRCKCTCVAHSVYIYFWMFVDKTIFNSFSIFVHFLH